LIKKKRERSKEKQKKEQGTEEVRGRRSRRKEKRGTMILNPYEQIESLKSPQNITTFKNNFLFCNEKVGHWKEKKNGNWESRTRINK